MSEQCRTSDGIQIQVQVTFQYNFQIEHLIDSLTTYGSKELTVNHMNRQAKAGVNTACSYFKAVDFTAQRPLIELNMSRVIEQYMNSSNSFVNVGAFQFRNFEYPSLFQKAVSDKQSTLQQKTIALSQRQGILVNATTQFRQAQEAVAILINSANAQALTLIDSAKLEADAILSAMDQTILQLKFEKEALGMTFADFTNYKKDTLLGSGRPVINLPALSL